MDRINITSNEANQRLDRFLRKYLPDTPLSEIYKLLRKNKVTVNGKKSREDLRIQEGDTVEIHSNAVMTRNQKLNGSSMDFSIVYEDKNIIIVDKPPGLILHPDAAHKENTLVDQVLYYLYKNSEYDPKTVSTFKPASVNRLDVNTGGMVIFAKNYPSLQNLNEMMRKRHIEKYYICIVKGSIYEEREIKAYITKDTKNNKAKITYSGGAGEREIHTRIIPLKHSKGYTLAEVDLITGRSHQIRAQLASIGNPIIGDAKYGDRRVNMYFFEEFGLKGQFLYAYKMTIAKASGNLKYLEGKSFSISLPGSYSNVVRKIFDRAMG